MTSSCADFLVLNGELGQFDRIVMNPPFERGADIEHIRHAYAKLSPGGRLVAICAQRPAPAGGAGRALLRNWIDLPAGSFKETGDKRERRHCRDRRMRTAGAEVLTGARNRERKLDPRCQYPSQLLTREQPAPNVIADRLQTLVADPLAVDAGHVVSGMAHDVVDRDLIS